MVVFMIEELYVIKRGSGSDTGIGSLAPRGGGSGRGDTGATAAGGAMTGVGAGDSLDLGCGLMGAMGGERV